MRILIALTLIVSMVLTINTMTFSANLDEFNGPNLDKRWTYRDPAKKGQYKFEGGKMILDLKAGADMYIKGVDAGVCFLMDPPNMDNFSVDMLLNPAVKGTQPPSCHVGIIFFNEAEWAYSAWGPYNGGQDIRLEDCVGADYRWRDQAKIGIDVANVAIDKDVYLKVTKTGTKLEFFAKGSANEQWKSAGTDEKLGPKYTPGKYKVGIVAKSWGGSVDSTFEIDYFNIPELSTTSVAPSAKLATTWSAIKL